MDAFRDEYELELYKLSINDDVRQFYKYDKV